MSSVNPYTFTSDTELVTKDKLNNLVSDLGTAVNGNIDSDNLKDNSITTAKIETGAITEGKLATDSVTATKIADGTITAAKLASGAVTDVKVKVSSNDTTAGYLNGKLVAGEGIDLTEGSDGGDETLTVIAEDSSTSNKGIVTLSTAPASAASPIVVGDNDTRVLTSAQNTALTGGASTSADSYHKHTQYDGSPGAWTDIDGWFSANVNTYFTKTHGITMTFPTDVLQFAAFWRDSSTGTYITELRTGYSDANGAGLRIGCTGTTLHIYAQTRFGNYTNSSGTNVACGNGELRIFARKLT